MQFVTTAAVAKRTFDRRRPGFGEIRVRRRIRGPQEGDVNHTDAISGYELADAVCRSFDATIHANLGWLLTTRHLESVVGHPPAILSLMSCSNGIPLPRNLFRL